MRVTTSNAAIGMPTDAITRPCSSLSSYHRSHGGGLPAAPRGVSAQAVETTGGMQLGMGVVWVEQEFTVVCSAQHERRELRHQILHRVWPTPFPRLSALSELKQEIGAAAKSLEVAEGVALMRGLVLGSSERKCEISERNGGGEREADRSGAQLRRQASRRDQRRHADHRVTGVPAPPASLAHDAGDPPGWGRNRPRLAAPSRLKASICSCFSSS